MEFRTEREGRIWGIRVLARVFGATFAGISLLFLIGESLETHPMGPNNAPESPAIVVWLWLVGICAVALLLALKWERPAVLSGVAALFGAHCVGLFRMWSDGHFSREYLSLPLLVFWSPLLLYLLCWWLERRTLRSRVEASLPDKA
jgi:hypothetical protein